MDRKYTERVELHCHSVYSQEDGVSTVKDIIEFAADNGMPAVALTDHACQLRIWLRFLALLLHRPFTSGNMVLLCQL